MKRAGGYRLMLAFCLLLLGCGGSNNDSPLASLNAGLYELEATSNSGPAANFRLNGNLMQTGSAIAGTMHITMPSCFSFNADIPVNGIAHRDAAGSFDLGMVLPDGQQLAVHLSHPEIKPSILIGTYSLTGPGCALPDQGGIGISGIDVTGTWHATFNPTGGPSSQGTISLTQTGPDAHGFFSATGTATLTGTCFTAGTVATSSLIMGKGSQLILDGPPGPAGKTTVQGDFQNLPFGGSTFNGTYTSTQGACSESGGVSMRFP